MKILVTGGAGFIGYHVVKRLLQDNHDIVIYDNMNQYYDPSLKYARLEQIGFSKDKIVSEELIYANEFPNLSFVKADLENKSFLEELFQKEKFDFVCHLAAQAGVRYSIENPDIYISSNINGFLNILEVCKINHIKHLTYASSSSVYGLNQKMPFSTADHTDHPVSLYAATKKSNELMAHTYSHLFGIPTTGLRFFTVYGPWGRPDMALFKFTKAILNGEKIEVYNNGEMTRDFTYVDDIVEGVVRVLFSPPVPNSDDLIEQPDSSTAPYRIYNIGNGRPERLMTYIDAIEKSAGLKAEIEFKPLQPGDVVNTSSDCTPLFHDFGFLPNTSITDGVEAFVTWYQNYSKSEI